MSLPLLRRSATYPLQVLIAGRVEDPLARGEIPQAPLTIQLRQWDAESREYEACPLTAKVQPDGTFAFFGSPDRAFPWVAERTYLLQLEVSGPIYRPLVRSLTVGPLAHQPALVTRTMPRDGIEPLQVRLFTHADLPRTNLVLRLERRAVRLRGRVMTTTVPPKAIAGATVAIHDDPSTITDAEGYFEFPNPMPLVLAIVLTVSDTESATNFVEERMDYELNYNQPVNELFFNLRPKS